MKRPNIAVLLAAYNGKNYLPEQLETILNQNDVNVSLFISVDKSIDGSESLIDDFVLKNERVIALPHGRVLGSAAKNFFRLLLETRLDGFDYISYADQDDHWQLDKLSQAVYLIVDQKAHAYSSNVVAFWRDGSKKMINKAQPQQDYDYMFESAGPGCTFVFKHKLAIELKKFLSLNQSDCQDLTLHDWFTYAFARSRGFKWVLDNKSYILYRQHDNNVIGANIGLEAKKERWKKMRGGWYRNQVLLIGALLEYDSSFPLKALKRYCLYDRLTLIIAARKLRRRLRDVLALAIYFIVTQKK